MPTGSILPLCCRCSLLKMDKNRDSVFSKENCMGHNSEKGTVCGAMYMHGSVTHRLAKACSEVHTVQWCVYYTESVTRHFYEFKNDITSLDASTTISYLPRKYILGIP